jgi:Dolichyl-phosphate-mannose-protein mannosyltransferase
MSAALQRHLLRLRDEWFVAAIWLALSAVMIWLSRGNIADRFFPDPDDPMRLLQVRDWLAGQSWFDVSQYRLNPPGGVPMHWSRLVDVPIGAVILLFRPMLGQFGAETVALTVVPLVTLAFAMLLLYRIAHRLLGSRFALVAVIAMSLSIGTLQQLRPMRIDHHGWQIVAALTATLAALDDRPRRSGIIAGVAMAVWLNISIEGLPMAAAFGGWFAFEWLRNSSHGQRLNAYLAALAGTSLLLFGLTHYPSTWLTQPRDVVTPAYLAGITAASLCCAVAVRHGVEDWRHRLARLPLAGMVALGAMFATDPHWFEGPFSSLDPVVKAMWYERVAEGLPLWRLDWSQIGIAVAQPIVGLAGALLALSRTTGAERDRWTTYTYLVCAATLATVMVSRAATTASILGLPGTVYLCELALTRARNVSLMPARVIATVAALFIIAPAYAVPVSMAPDDKPLEHAVARQQQCFGRTEMEKLRALPTGMVAAPLDFTPDILVNTPHRAIASGHHRGGGGMRDVIRLFMLPPSEGSEIIARRQVDYVVTCPDAPETIMYARSAPQGLSAMLNAGRAPAWLEPIAVPGLRAVRVWRVRKS